MDYQRTFWLIHLFIKNEVFVVYSVNSHHVVYLTESGLLLFKKTLNKNETIRYEIRRVLFDHHAEESVVLVVVIHTLFILSKTKTSWSYANNRIYYKMNVNRVKSLV